VRLVVVSLVVAAGCAGCAADDVVFYEVTRSRVEECAIRSNGEFCVEPEQFDPPETTVWTVEIQEHVSRLFVDEEVWVLDPLAEGDDPYAVEQSASRDSTVTSGAGPCTSTKSETISFSADRTTFSGSLFSQTVLSGPAACGDTPVGERSEDELAGSAFTADGVPVGP
jgi:hypothetical protein